MTVLAAVLLGACMIDSTTFAPLGDDAGTGDDCDAGCEAPSVPQLRLPMNDSYVGVITATNSLRPTFVWEPSTGPDGATITYELEYSRDATFVTGVTTVPTTLTNHRPSDPLEAMIIQPVGARYYWRVRACAGDVCSASSSAWWVNVGRSNRDFNGDGLGDALVGARGTESPGQDAGTAYVILGNAAGAFDITDGVSGMAAEDSFGARVAFAGDVNGDGFADVAVGAPGVGPFHGAAYVYLGGPTGMFGEPFELPGEAAGANAGIVSSGGDVNGDGFSDVIVGAAGANSTGRAYLYLGGAGSTFNVVADATLDGENPNDSFGRSVSSAGDVNGDGYADLLVGADTNDAGGDDAGRAYVYLGDAALDAEPDGVLTGAATGDGLGLSTASAGDVNGDGYSDVVVGAYLSSAGGTGSGVAYVYFGAAGQSFDEAPEGTIPGSAGDTLGFSVASAGDVNGDAFADIVLGAMGNDDTYVYFGAAGPAFDTTADGALSGPAPGELFGFSVAGAGDMDGDGFDDVIVGATSLSGTSTGAAFIFRGGQGQTFDETSDRSFLGTAIGDYFGGSVSSL